MTRVLLDVKRRVCGSGDVTLTLRRGDAEENAEKKRNVKTSEEAEAREPCGDEAQRSL
jgi:hypothetical protein